MSENTITREAAAKRLGCSMRTVERMLRDGRLQPIRHPDGRLAVDRADLEMVLREPKLLDARRARADGALRADPSVAPLTVLIDPDLPTRTPEPEPSRPSLLERVTPLSLELDSSLPAISARPARSAVRSRLRHSVVLVVIGLALAALAVWVLSSSGSPRPQASGKSATQHREARLPTVPTGSTRLRAAPTTGGREPASRGGLASLIVTRAPGRVEPASRGEATVRSAQPSSGHAPTKPSSVSANCGFGSLTYAGC